MGRAHDHRQFVPVAEVPCCDAITAGVEELARACGFQASSYYHDLPIWIISEPEFSKKRVRRLQVVAYLVSRNPYISFIPSVHFVTERRTIKIPRQTPSVRFSLEIFLKNGDFDRKAFAEQLQESWEKTGGLTYPEQDLMEVELSDALC